MPTVIIGQSLSAMIILMFATIAMAGSPSVTTFTYQGQLKSGGVPLDGNVDMDFALWNAEIDGETVGPSHVKVINVQNGLFQVHLDFGVNAFAAPRWLSISIRNPSGVGSFEPVLPRQRLTSSPYSITTRGIVVDGDNNVGIGTSTPDANLHIDGTGSSAVGFHMQAPGDSTGDILMGSPFSHVGIVGRANNGNSRGIYFMDTGLGLFTRSSSSSPFTGNGVFIDEAGNFAVGNTQPTKPLDVDGDGNFRNRLGIGNPSALTGQLTVGDSGDGSFFAISADWNHASFPTVFVNNDGNGGGIWVEGPSDVSLGGGGLIVAGNQAGKNIGIDGNEIMARDGGSVAPLHLNNEGGDVIVGGTLDIGWQFITADIINGNGVNSGEAYCPAGKRPLGGGCTSLVGIEDIHSSKPTCDGNGCGWHCFMSGSEGIRVYVICAQIK